MNHWNIFQKGILQVLGLFILSICFTQIASAQVVSLEDAELVAQNYFYQKDLSLGNAADAVITDTATGEVNGEVFYYIFEINNQGFVIVSADERSAPILGYATHSNTDFNNIPDGVQGRLNNYQIEIEHLRTNNIIASENNSSRWANLKDDRYERIGTDRDDIVAPLTSTIWGQEEFYNAMAPADVDGPAGHTFLGCVPVSMGQLIKFWGDSLDIFTNGQLTYTDPNYGEQSANFATTDYDFAAMPDELTTFNDDVAQFLYHVGVSTQTEYSPTYSSTYFSYVRDAFVHIWGFDCDAVVYSKEFTDPVVWDQIIKDELDAGRPVYLRGEADGGVSHAWIVDGYNEEGQYHMNWGWHGDWNGYWTDTGASWSSSGGVITYYQEQYGIFGLQPGDGCQACNDTSYATVLDNNTSAYFYTNQPVGPVNIQFRYREVGTTDWIETEISDNYYAYTADLEEDKTYEFEVRKQCGNGDWSPYVNLQQFETSGTPPGPEECTVPAGNSLSTSATSTVSSYIYSTSSTVINQFRYRPVGATNWELTDEQDLYYRFITGLQAGTEYEFQVRELCSDDTWSDWSESQTFTTQGGITVECGAPDSSSLSTSATGNTNSYIYYLSAPSNTDNEFRYRAVGTADWMTTAISTSYYRYLSDLTPGTEYEFQFRYACANSTNGWTEFTESATFTTTGSNGGGGDCNTSEASSLYTSSTGYTGSYVYTPLTNSGNNQFRYRPVGTSSWSESDISGNYYRYLSDLQSGTEYEYQVRFQCGTEWSEYSDSATFTTLGGNTGGDCDAPLLADVSSSIVSSTSMYLYYFKAGAGANVQFRYKAVGSSTWIETPVAALYYTYVTGLTSATDYEFESRVQCGSTWSDYSGTAYFTTQE